jgi:hypothetical protein
MWITHPLHLVLFDLVSFFAALKLVDNWWITMWTTMWITAPLCPILPFDRHIQRFVFN